MTTAERKLIIQQAQKRFYAWRPGDTEDAHQTFKCWHIEPYPCMSDYVCQKRATNPKLFRQAGCSSKCPRWWHYRKLAKKVNGKPIRIPYL